MLTDGSFGRALSLNGFTASGSANVISIGQVTAEVGGYYGKGIRLMSFLAGPQATFHIYRFQPFVRGLFGVSHTTVGSVGKGNSFTIAAGGGLNFELTDQIAIRALQVDYYRPYGGPYKNADFLRMGFGVNYEFGSR
jgi:opacity protein-like surface antigen